MYVGFIKRHMPRLLSQVNRDADLITYGSCDRNYWHQSIRDFSSAILQQACLSLALVWRTDFPGNIWYGSANVREWAAAALRYMGKIQLPDGSFNEYYPNEHSFPATAFNLFAGCRAYRLLELGDEEVLATLGRAADWLCAHDETKTCNQQAAAIAGLYRFYGMTGRREILEAAERKLEALLALYSQEGWFPEQGGADIGYSSVTLDMLTEVYEESGDGRLRSVLGGMVDFLSHFVHPDGTIGGEYGSRNTVYFLPSGLETCVRLGIRRETASAMIDRLFGKDAGESFMDSVDDRYLSHYVMHSFLRALAGYTPRKPSPEKLPYETIHSRYYPEAGLMTRCTGAYYAVVSLRKGGLVKVYRGDEEVLNDCGYRVPWGKGRTAVTNWLNPDLAGRCEGDSLEISGRMTLVKPRTQNPRYHVLLRLAALVRGARLRDDIKRMTIFQKASCSVRFARKVTFLPDGVRIRDTIDNPTGRAVLRAPNVSLRLVASAKFFSRSDLLPYRRENYGAARRLSVVRSLRIRDGKAEVTEEAEREDAAIRAGGAAERRG